jgi:hypothetical protein
MFPVLQSPDQESNMTHDQPDMQHDTEVREKVSPDDTLQL